MSSASFSIPLPLLLAWFINLYNLLLSLLSLLPLTPYLSPSPLSMSTVTVLGLTSTLLLPPTLLLNPHPPSSSSPPSSPSPSPSPSLLLLLTCASLLSLSHLPLLALSHRSPLNLLLHHNLWQPLISLTFLLGTLITWLRERWWLRRREREDEGWEAVEDWATDGRLPGGGAGGGEMSGYGGAWGGGGGGGGTAAGRVRSKKKMSEKYEALLNGSEFTVESDDEDQSAIF